MFRLIQGYSRWLHTGWPAGTVERMPEVNDDGTTAVPGLYVAGDLTGVPLLKLAADSGARAARRAVASLDKGHSGGDGARSLAIVGGGVAGYAAALEARRLGVDFTLIEAAAPFATIAGFPMGKPIFTYPTAMTPTGELQFSENIEAREDLLAELRGQATTAGVEPTIARVERVRRRGGTLELEVLDGEPIHARRVIVAIGRSGDFRRLGVPGEGRDRVMNRLHDPAAFRDQPVLVVGGGDSAVEAAVALAGDGARVALSTRKPALTRPKPKNIARLGELASTGAVELHLGSTVREIRERDALIEDADGETRELVCAAVFTLVGREPPLGFFRRSGVPIRGEWRLVSWVGLIVFLAVCAWIYHWKKKYGWAFGDAVDPARAWDHLASLPSTMGAMARDPSTLLGTLRISASSPGFYYTLLYSLVILIFGLRRIRRRRTPYVTWQTVALMSVQWLPLFLLPEIILPLLGHNGAFGEGSWLADQLFPAVGYGHGREYWRAYGFILAWPLFFANVFTGQPIGLWLGISLAQTFAIIPLIVHRWGKGAYCGWICSCGALAETLGDTRRQKMPHGPGWNRLNMLGQVFLGLALVLLVLRVLGWTTGSTAAADAYELIFKGRADFASWPAGLAWLEHPLAALNYAWFVDLLWAGILGVGLYFHLSGRVWCRFACPLAALMHIYARLGTFRILADKKRCISCNVCTAVCHQGIDVMSFANKGQPMADPQCVRCSACVQSCPTGVLEFGRVRPRTGEVIATDRLAASPTRISEAS